MASNSPQYLELAAEILENIFSNLSRHQLTHVVRVCRPFALSGRLLLYRSVDLRSDDPYIKETVNLLRGEQNIGVKILSATLTTHRPPGSVRHQPWIDPDFFVHWARLRSLELRGFPFSLPSDIKSFATTLRNSCPKLEKFTYRPVFGFLPREGFQLVGLKAVTWQSERATIEMPVTPVMVGSVNTLTHISFIGTIIHRSEKPYDDFLELRFPFLKSLELGSLEHSNPEARTTTAITSFILAHPAIEHLSLGKTRPSDFFFQFDSDQLKPESLPHLKSFEGFPENITALARRPVHSLFSIISLSLCCPKDEDNSTQLLRDMFVAVSSAEGTARRLPFVRDIRFVSFVVMNHLMPSHTTSRAHREWMDELSHMCPGVVRWYGKLPPMTADYFMNMFAMYEHLEIISLPWFSVFIHLPSSKIEYFTSISEKCKKLKTVIARRPQYTELGDNVFTLGRDAAGNLSSVEVRDTRDELIL